MFLPNIADRALGEKVGSARNEQGGRSLPGTKKGSSTERCHPDKNSSDRGGNPWLKTSGAREPLGADNIPTSAAGEKDWFWRCLRIIGFATSLSVTLLYPVQDKIPRSYRAGCVKDEITERDDPEKQDKLLNVANTEKAKPNHVDTTQLK